MILHYSELSNNLRLIKLNGRLDILGSGEIEQKLAGYCAADQTRMLVDLSDVEFLTSYGIRLLVRNAKELADRGGHMYLVAPASHVKDTLEVSGVTSIIPVYETLALAKFALEEPNA